jgi:glycosyltransferase 2 family protein
MGETAAQAAQRRRARVPRAVGWLVTAVLVAVGVGVVAGRWESVQEAGGLPGLTPSALAVVAYFAANLLLAYTWREVVGLTGVRLQTGVAMWVWAVSQLARYAVGAAQVGGRAVAGRRYGLTLTTGAATTLVEVGWQTSLSAALVLATLPWWLPAAGGLTWLAWVGILPVAVLLAGLVHPRGLVALLGRAARTRPVSRVTGGRLAAVEDRVAMGRWDAGRLTLLYAANTALRLAGFLALFAALGGTLRDDALVAVGAYALGQLVGRLAVFAPGGLGPREGATALAVTPAIGAGPAVVLVAATRLLEAVAELGFVGLARLTRPPGPIPGEPDPVTGQRGEAERRYGQVDQTGQRGEAGRRYGQVDQTGATNEPVLRRATSDDDEAIRALLGRNFPENPKRFASFTRWQYWENPFGEASSWVWQAHGRVVAHWAAIPVPMVLDGRRVTGAKGVDIATDPAFRGRGLFRSLGEALRRDCAARAIPVILTHPNPNAARGVEQAGAQHVARVPVYVRPLDDHWLARRFHLPRPAATAVRRAVFPLRQAEGAARADGPPDGLDDLWARAGREVRNGIVRDAAWWAWRYGDRPGSDYRYLAVRRRGRLSGAAVLTERKAFGGRFAFVLEFLAADLDAARSLAAGAAVHADAVGLACAALPGTPLALQLVRSGFRRLPRRLEPHPFRFMVFDCAGLGGLPDRPWSMAWGDLDHL